MPQPAASVWRWPICFLVVISALFFGTAAEAQDRALIIAIDEYADSRIAYLPANMAANDTAAIEKLLTGRLGYKPEEIKVLRNEEATREAILNAITDWLSPESQERKAANATQLKGLDESGALDGNKKKKAKSKKLKWVPPPKVYRSYLYVSGLGYFTPDTDADEADGFDETLVPYDASVRDDDAAGGISGMISDDEVEALLSRFRYRDVTLVLDTSHSGLVTRSRNLAGRVLSRMRVPRVNGAVRRIAADDKLAVHKKEGAFADVRIPGGSLTVWSAASPTQTALIAGEDDTPKGLFTLLYAEGIQSDIADTNENGIVSNAELLRHVVSSSARYCRLFRERCEMGLRPRLDPPSAYGKSAWVDRKKVSHRKEREMSLERLLDFLGSDEDSSIEIVQSPASPVHVGESDIRYAVKTPTAGYLVLLNLTDKGELFQLFPNQFVGGGANLEARLVHANAPLVVPDESYGVSFKATVPGKGHIIAILTPDPVRFHRTVTARPIASVSSDEAIKVYLAHLAAALHAPVYDTLVEADTDSARWSIKTMPYEIMPRTAASKANRNQY